MTFNPHKSKNYPYKEVKSVQVPKTLLNIVFVTFLLGIGELPYKGVQSAIVPESLIKRFINICPQPKHNKNNFLHVSTSGARKTAFIRG